MKHFKKLLALIIVGTMVISSFSGILVFAMEKEVKDSSAVRDSG